MKPAWTKYSKCKNVSEIKKTSEPAEVSETKIVRVIDGDTIEIEGG